jgi:hypothetical protein
MAAALPPSVMRNALHDTKHRGVDVAHLHLREDADPAKIQKSPRRKPSARSRTDRRSGPQAVSPPIQPVLHRSFDWYAQNRDNMLGRDFHGENVNSPPQLPQIAVPEKERAGLQVGRRYMYKRLDENRRHAGVLQEITDKYCVFMKNVQCYISQHTVRWDQLETVWASRGGEEVWQTQVDPAKLNEHKELQEKRAGWKSVQVPHMPRDTIGRRKQRLADPIGRDIARASLYASLQ